MGKNDAALLIKKLERYAKAKKPIDANLLEKIPYFTDIFPDKKLWSVLVRLAKKDLITHEEGIAYIEHKKYRPGEHLITKGLYDQMIYWVLSGHAHIIGTIKNQPKTIYEAKEGECIGELSVLRSAMRTADVVAGEDGVSVLQIDWSIIEKSSELGKNLYHLITLHLADKLDMAYKRQLKIISNSIKVLEQKITGLFERNRELEKLLIKSKKTEGKAEPQTEQNESLIQAINNIKESLALLESHKGKDKDKGTVKSKPKSKAKSKAKSKGKDKGEDKGKNKDMDKDKLDVLGII